MRLLLISMLFAALLPGQSATATASECRVRFQKELDANPRSSGVHFRVAECEFEAHNYQGAANEYREALSGDMEPSWTEVWALLELGKIFDISGQRDRALHQYRLAEKTHDNTRGAQNEIAKYLETPYRRPR